MDDLARKLAVLDDIWGRRQRVVEYVIAGEAADSVAAEEYVEHVRGFAATVRAGEAYPRLCLYAHVPLCFSKCFYCNCASKRIASRDEIGAYLEAVTAEMDLVAPLLGGVSADALYVGGGTPNILSPRQLDRLLAHLLGRFARAPRFHFGCEMNPQGATRAHLEVLKSHGVDRISFGVQSLTPHVLAGVARGYQTADKVRRAIRLAREVGIEAVNVDVIAGLPGETDESFVDSLREVRAMEPDSIVVYRLFAEMSPLLRYGFDLDDGDRGKRDRQLRVARDLLCSDGGSLTGEDLYACGWGRFERPAVHNVYETLRQDLAATTIGFGPGAESHVHGRVIARHGEDLPSYRSSLARGALPPIAAHRISDGIEMAMHVGNNLDRGALREEAFAEIFRRDFGEVFGVEMEHLRREGCVVREGGAWRKAPADDDGFLRTSFLVNALFYPLRSLEAALDRIRREEAEALVPAPGRRGTSLVRPHPVLAESDTTVLHLLHTCNLGCRSCPWRERFDGTAVEDSEIEAVLAEVARTGARRVDLVGGEPTIDPRLVPLVRRIRAANVAELVLWTNGRMLRYPEFARALREAGVTRLVVSLHGPDAATHDAETRVPGSLADTLAGIAAAVREGFGEVRARLLMAEAMRAGLARSVRELVRLGVRRFLIEYVDAAQLDHEQCGALHQLVSAYDLDVRFHRRVAVRTTVDGAEPTPPASP